MIHKGMNTMRQVSVWAVLALASFSQAQEKSAAASARAEVKNGQGAMLGTVVITETAAGLRLSGELKDLPAGTHGVHFHQVGKCDPPDFKSAGDHFNPAHKQHGSLNPQGPHAGDMDNVMVGSNGNLSMDVVAKNLTLKAGPASIIGTSLVIHAKADDRRTDPSGNSGDRIACGMVSQ